MHIQKYIKSVGVLVLALLIIFAFSISVYATDEENLEDTGDGTQENPFAITSLTDPYSGDLISSVKSIQDQDYWIDLEKKTVPYVANSQGEHHYLYGIFPEYLPGPNDSNVDKYVKLYGDQVAPTAFSNSGITSNGHSMDALTWHMHGGVPTDDNKELGKQAWRNSYTKYTDDQVLSQAQLDDADNQLIVTGDLDGKSADGSYAAGDPVSLTFSLNAAWFNKYLRTFQLNDLLGCNTYGDATRDATLENDQNRLKTLSNPYMVSDAGLTYTLKIPAGVSVFNPSVSISGLDGFTATVEKNDTNTDGTKTLVIQVRKNIENVVKTKWQDELKKIDEQKLGNIQLSISGLKVSDQAEPGQTMQIIGTAAGFYDLAYTENEAFTQYPKDQQTSNDQRVYFFFAAKQGNTGRDSTLDDAHKNMISYSFKVSKPEPVTPVTPVEDHTVTFHPANGQSDFTQTVADGNKVSQPADPAQDGYTFDGWYTDSALTNAYDFNTPVKNDMDLYAKWTKNKVTGILLPKVIASGSSKQTLTWTPLTNVDGYYVYEAYCNTYKHVHPFKKVADVSASSPRVYKRSGLKKGAAYKYYVAAYQIKNGKKQVVKKSVTVHSAAGNLLKTKNVKYTNVKSVSVKKNAVTLKVGKTYRIQPSAKGVYSGYAILQKGHAAMFRYFYIKDGKNIKVSQNGTVKALKAGKCNVYVLGTNGVRTKVAVTVVK